MSGRKYDLIDYAAWYGNFSLFEREFNEADNLLLSCLAYAEFSGIADKEEVDLKNAFEKYKENIETEGEEKLNIVPVKGQEGGSLELFEIMANSRRFSSARLFAYKSIIDKEQELQFAALVIRLESGLCYVAFRGTDDSLVGWKEDFNMSYMEKTPGQKLAGEYLNELFDKYDIDKVYLGGHSKGGNLALSAALFCRPTLLPKIRRIYTNDGPGFSSEIVESDRYNNLLKRTISIVPKYCVIGNLLENRLSHKYVESSAKGMDQHHLLTWLVDSSGKMLKAEPDGQSLLIEKVMQKWMESLSLEQRETVVDSFFDMLEDANTPSFSYVLNNKVKTFQTVMSRLGKLPKEKEDMVRDAIGKLFDAAKEVYPKVKAEDKEQNKGVISGVTDSIVNKSKSLYKALAKQGQKLAETLTNRGDKKDEDEEELIKEGSEE